MLSNARLFAQTASQLDHGRLTALINSMTDGFLAVSQTGEIELSNSVALSLLDTNSLAGKNIVEAMPIIDAQGQAQDVLKLIQKAGHSFISRDYRLKNTDGKFISLYLNISAVRGVYGKAGPAGYVVLLRDITREKSEQDERDEFISVASHELRNPVAVAEGSVSNALMLAKKAQTPDSVVQTLTSAHDQIIFLGGLINDLAMISRADRQKFVDAAAEFDPTEVLKALLNDYAAKAQAKGLKIVLEAAQLPKIFGSKLYTREILQNFVTNALKYTDKGAIKIEGKLAGDGIDLSVSDTGYGIDSTEQKKLFTKFFRSDDSRVRQINGTGLGLYVSLKLARLMGGGLSLKSELNHGSTFTLHLPAKPTANPIA